MNTIQGPVSGAKIYNVAVDNITNGPFASSSDYRGFLLVLNLAGAYLFQIYFNPNERSNKIYNRCFWAAAWSSWKEL